MDSSLPQASGARARRSRGERSVVEPAAARGRRRRGDHVSDLVERGQELAAARGGGREVLVLVGDARPPRRRDAAPSRAITASTSSSGADAPAVTPTVPVRSSGSSSARVDAVAPRAQPDSRASFSSARVLDELAEPMTTTASHRAAIAVSADCRFVVAKHRSLRPGHPHVGEALPRWRRARRPTRGATASSARAARPALEVGQRRDVVDGLDQVDRRRARRPSCRPPPRGPRGRRTRSGSPCRPAPSPRGGPW